jgi:hypothetical protein
VRRRKRRRRRRRRDVCTARRKNERGLACVRQGERESKSQLTETKGSTTDKIKGKGKGRRRKRGRKGHLEVDKKPADRKYLVLKEGKGRGWEGRDNCMF